MSVNVVVANNTKEYITVLKERINRRNNYDDELVDTTTPAIKGYSTRYRAPELMVG